MEVRFATIRQWLLSALIVGSTLSIFFFRFTVSSSDPSLATLYVIPVMVAALFMNPLAALGITTVVLAGYSFDAWGAGVALMPWAFQSFVLIAVAFLGINWSHHERGRSELVAKTKRLSEERLQLIDKLTESRLEREQYVGAVIFETKGLLDSILSFAGELARDNVLSSDAQKSRLESVVSETRHMVRLVEDMQTSSRIERGRFTILPTSSELRRLVSRVVLEQQAQTSRHELGLKILDEDVSVCIDEAQVERVIEYLIKNAINYSPHGGKIEISLAQSNGFARVSVTDRGIGIAQADLPRLFKPYVRLAPSKGTPGIGLGLFVAKAIIEAHGGHFWVESKLGFGSVFHFSLPTLASGEPALNPPSATTSTD